MRSDAGWAAAQKLGGALAAPGPDLFAHLCQCFAEQCIDVGMLAGRLDGSPRGSAEIDRDMRFLYRFYRDEAALEAIMLALVIERRRLGPQPAKQAHIVFRAFITLILVEKITAALLFVVGCAGDDVYGGTFGAVAGRSWRRCVQRG